MSLSGAGWPLANRLTWLFKLDHCASQISRPTHAAVQHRRPLILVNGLTSGGDYARVETYGALISPSPRCGVTLIARLFGFRWGSAVLPIRFRWDLARWPPAETV